MNQPVDHAAQRLVQQHLDHLHEVQDTLSPAEKQALLEAPTLYLDGDTMVRRDIGPLFAPDPDQRPIAAVRDPAHECQEIPSGLEDVFIHLMRGATDNSVEAR